MINPDIVYELAECHWGPAVNRERTWLVVYPQAMDFASGSCRSVLLDNPEHYSVEVTWDTVGDYKMNYYPPLDTLFVRDDEEIRRRGRCPECGAHLEHWSGRSYCPYCEKSGE